MNAQLRRISTGAEGRPAGRRDTPILARHRPVTDVARVTVTPWDDDSVVKLNSRSGIDPEIDQWTASPFWGSERFGDRVAVVQIFVAGEIAVYEYDCKGTSRRQYALTDSFRQECDARGSLSQPQTRVGWTSVPDHASDRIPRDLIGHVVYQGRGRLPGPRPVGADTAAQ